VSESQVIEKVYWSTPGDILAISHGGQISMDLIPPGIASLAGTDIAHQLVVMAKIRDESGREIGLHTEIETFPRDGSDEFEVILTVVIAGRGTLVVREMKSYSNPMIMDLFNEALEKGEWRGEIDVLQTTGPAPGGYGLVIAATGEFEGMTGLQRQTSTFRRITPAVSDVDTCETFWLSR